MCGSMHNLALFLTDAYLRGQPHTRKLPLLSISPALCSLGAIRFARFCAASLPMRCAVERWKYRRDWGPNSDASTRSVMTPNWQGRCMISVSTWVPTLNTPQQLYAAGRLAFSAWKTHVSSTAPTPSTQTCGQIMRDGYLLAVASSVIMQHIFTSAHDSLAW